MFERLAELVLPHIIGIMVHKRETLTAKERRAQETFMAQLVVKKRKTHTPLVIALVGLVGSGKSSVARELAAALGATIVEGDAIRVGLRAQSERYERARAIAEHAAIEIVKQGGTVILDSDFVDAKKTREHPRKNARVWHTRSLHSHAQRLRHNGGANHFGVVSHPYE